jgi:DNA polymerase III subunit beta
MTGRKDGHQLTTNKKRRRAVKLKLKTNDLKNWMGRLIKLARGGNQIPVLDTVRLEAHEEGHVTLDFTNGDLWMKTEFSATVSIGGVVLVNAKKLFEASKLLPDQEITFEMSPKGLKVYGKSAVYTFATITASDFPSEPALVLEEKALKMEVSASLIHSMIKAVESSISSDDSRYLLQSIKLEVDGSVIRLVATDGRRLSLYERDLKELGDQVLSSGEHGEALIPSDAVSVIRDLCADSGVEVVRILANDKALDFWWASDTAWLRVKLVDGKFPAYRNVIPDFLTRSAVTISPDEWSDAISSVLAIAVTTGKDKTPKLVISKDSFKLEEPEVGSAQVDVETPGVEDVAVNAQFLRDAIKSIPTAKAVYYPGAPMDPLVLTLPDHGPKNPIRWTHVLMPIRTSGGGK